jgi:Leucine-rich repeat (LRR) protein
MANKNDVFKFEKNGSWGDFLVIETKRLASTIDFIEANKIKNIWISKYHGYGLKNISFLEKIKTPIEGLIIIDGDIKIDGIEILKSLKMLSLNDETGFPLDLSNFKMIDRCSLLWNKKISHLSTCKKVKELNLKNVSDPDFLKESLQELKAIKELVLIKCKMSDLEFISDQSTLEDLQIYYSPILYDISAIERCKKLQKLIIDHCKKIDAYDFIKKLSNLTFLTISDSAEIKTLNFLNGLKKLKHFGFVGTTIKDGDLSPCLKITHVGFNNKKGYSHTYEEMQNRRPIK